MDNWQVALLTLAALMVGMIVPVLVQLRATMITVRDEVKQIGAHLLPMLDDARVSVQRIGRLTESLEGNEENLSDLLRSAGALAHSLDRLRTSANIASAVAAAVATGVRVFRDTKVEHTVAAEVTPSSSHKNGEATNREEPQQKKEMS